MSEILILARIRIHEFDLPIVTDYYFDVSQKLSRVKGSNGISVWRDQRDLESFLVMYEYADLEAAERGLVAISQIRILAETQLADFRPADVQRIRIADYYGRRISETDTYAVLSLSQQVADPGYGPDLLEDLNQLLAELACMPGYIGAVYGTNDVLDEEVFGIVTWESREDFLASLPPHAYARDIKLYGRFF